MAKVGIVMGSDSDMPVMKKAADMLQRLLVVRHEPHSLLSVRNIDPLPIIPPHSTVH